MNIPGVVLHMHALEGKTRGSLCFSPETTQVKFPVLGIRDPESEGSTLLCSYFLPLEEVPEVGSRFSHEPLAKEGHSGTMDPIFSAHSSLSGSMTSC